MRWNNSALYREVRIMIVFTRKYTLQNFYIEREIIKYQIKYNFTEWNKIKRNLFNAFIFRFLNFQNFQFYLSNFSFNWLSICYLLQIQNLRYESITLYVKWLYFNLLSTSFSQQAFFAKSLVLFYMF